MKNRPLATQFRIMLSLIILSSIIATLITYIVVAVLFLNAINSNSVYPENYYEQQIPEIEKAVREAKSSVLSASYEAELRQMMQGEEFFYQVADNKNHILYGTYKDKIFETEEQMLHRFNTTFKISEYYVYAVPVIDGEGKIEGAVSLVYKLSFASANKRKAWINVAINIALLSPFLYIIIFTILFSNRFARNISAPLKSLVEGSQQIKEKNLDFEIDYHADNELGELCTAFSEMKEELKKSLSAQWKLEQERVEMVEALAHDLKSPLSIIKVYSEALADDTDVDEEQRQYLTVIEENIEKSVSLVQQMQYTSDLDNSSVSVVSLPVDLREFLKRKACEYTLQAKQEGVEVLLSVQDNIPTPVFTDIDKLERILDNIVTNSLQYTPAGGRIDISAKADEKYVYYTVCDTGTGFSAKDMEKAFERFYRGDEARQSKGGHSGLGLYIVKQLAVLLGGDVKIENGREGGACVMFYMRHSVIKLDMESTPRNIIF